MTRRLLLINLVLALSVSLWAQTNADEQIKPNDTLTVTVADHPELSKTNTVRADGKVEMPVLGTILVGGFTVAELHKNLERAYGILVASPRISIERSKG